MKRIISICLAVMMAITLASCHCNYTNNPKGHNVMDRFKMVYSDPNSQNAIFVDEETHVMYFYYRSGYAGGLSVMVNRDGTPLLWETTP